MWIPFTKGQYCGTHFHAVDKRRQTATCPLGLRTGARLMMASDCASAYASAGCKQPSGESPHYGRLAVSLWCCNTVQLVPSCFWRKGHGRIWSARWVHLCVAKGLFEIPGSDIRNHVYTHVSKSFIIPTFGIRARAALSCVRGKNAGGYGCYWGAQCRQAPIPRVACVLILINFYQRFQAL